MELSGSKVRVSGFRFRVPGFGFRAWRWSLGFGGTDHMTPLPALMHTTGDGTDVTLDVSTWVRLSRFGYRVSGSRMAVR